MKIKFKTLEQLYEGNEEGVVHLFSIIGNITAEGMIQERERLEDKEKRIKLEGCL